MAVSPKHITKITEPEVKPNQTPSASKYPPGLIDEYHRLALKELETPLSVEEKARLQEVMDQINSIDENDPTTKLMHAEDDRIDVQLEQIRQEAEALIKAKANSDLSTPEQTSEKRGTSRQTRRKKKYPPKLMREYQELTRKKLLNQQSPEEDVCLLEVKEKLSAIDEADPSAQVWRVRFAEIREELEQIGREAEALLSDQQRDGVQKK